MAGGLRSGAMFAQGHDGELGPHDDAVCPQRTPT